ncbi:MAG: hypothetical protein RLZZ387_2961 [Chloroflexota bacterium]|jgi:PII-like signaling protein/predicted transcriptional regulator
MSATEPVQRVRIYLSERDAAEGQPLYLVTLERLRREGATGATAIKGVAGFGAGHRLGGIVELGQSIPVVIEWVDRADRVARVLPALDELLSQALITVEDLRVYRAVLRSGGPFGGRSVGEVLQRTSAAAPPHAPLAEAIEFLLRSRMPLLPVAQEGRVTAVLGDAELQRLGAPPLHVLAALPQPERVALLSQLGVSTVGEAASGDPRTLYIETAVAQTVSVLVEWGLEAMPVIDRDGRLAGLFGVEQALRAAVESRPEQSAKVRDADPPPPVSLIMQMHTPTVPATTPLHEALSQLLSSQGRFLVVVNGWTPVGVITDAHVAARLLEAARPLWLEALRGRAQITQAALEVAGPLTAADLALPPSIVRTRDTQDDAIRMALEGGHERLVVVDDEGRVAGLVTRRGLLRALAQSSAA